MLLPVRPGSCSRTEEALLWNLNDKADNLLVATLEQADLLGKILQQSTRQTALLEELVMLHRLAPATIVYTSATEGAVADATQTVVLKSPVPLASAGQSNKK
jgi:hypothetical protein